MCAFLFLCSVLFQGEFVLFYQLKLKLSLLGSILFLVCICIYFVLVLVFVFVYVFVFVFVFVFVVSVSLKSLRPHSLPTKEDALSTALHRFSKPYCVGWVLAQSSVRSICGILWPKSWTSILARAFVVLGKNSVCSNSQCRLWIGSIAAVL